jgi:hypothetical protein
LGPGPFHAGSLQSCLIPFLLAQIRSNGRVSDPSATPARSRCQNCGAELLGHFCHRCGQQDFDFHRSFGHVFLEALESLFHFDSKFFRNIVTLLLRPGQLSAEFNAGKRASQVPPFRLYVFVSFLFFFIRFLGSGPDESGIALIGPGAESRAGLTEALRSLADETTDPVAKQRLQATAARLGDPALKDAALTREEMGDLKAALIGRARQEQVGAETRRKKGASDSDWVKDAVKDKKADTPLGRLVAEKAKFVIQHREEIEEAFVHALPKMLLVCLPFFALYSRMLFPRGGLVYIQHLIIALHFHTFVFLCWLVLDGWSGLLGLWRPGLGYIVSLICWWWILQYPFVMLRRLFGQPWISNTLKGFALVGAYSCTLVLGFLLTAIIVVMTA